MALLHKEVAVMSKLFHAGKLSACQPAIINRQTLDRGHLTSLPPLLEYSRRFSASYPLL